MTYNQILARLAEIEDLAPDDAAAHSAEDVLMEDFIKYIAGLGEFRGLQKKAKLVLESHNICFSRWCA